MIRSGAAVVVVAATAALLSAVTPAAHAATGCAPWAVSTVATGFGLLENLTFDGRGSMIVSESSPSGPGALRTVSAAGEHGTLVAEVDSPGGLVRDGTTLYFATGNSTAAGLFGLRNGTVETVDLETGVRSMYASGLTMPNGLARASDGDLFATRNLGDPMGVTRITPDREVSSVRSDLGSANGIAIDGTRLFVATTFEPESRISVLDLNAPSTDEVRQIPVDGFGPFTVSDDMTVGSDGMIYLAQNVAGRVLRIDPETAASCVVSNSVPFTSSVEFGGAGFDSDSLYATSFDGSVRKLSPA